MTEAASLFRFSVVFLELAIDVRSGVWVQHGKLQVYHTLVT